MSLAFAEDNKTTTSSHWPQWLMIAALVYLLLVAVATVPMIMAVMGLLANAKSSCA